MAFLVNIGIGITYQINDEDITSETIGDIQIQPKISTSHAMIVIIGDSELDSFCAGNGTDGTSWETAHVIENYEINSALISGITIDDTTRFLIIQNCIIDQSDSVGIDLDNCTNIRIQNSTLELNSGPAIAVEDCEEIFIRNTNIINNYDVGIYLENTNNTEIIKSNICPKKSRVRSFLGFSKKSSGAPLSIISP